MYKFDTVHIPLLLLKLHVVSSFFPEKEKLKEIIAMASMLIITLMLVYVHF